jgi:predicted O-methyltransferase YrrM
MMAGFRSALRSGLRHVPPLARILEQRDELQRKVDSLRSVVEARDATIAAQRTQLAQACSDRDELEPALSELRGSVGAFPPGHYHSPIPPAAQWKAALSHRDRPIPGVELDTDHQLSRLDGIAPFIADTNFPETSAQAAGSGFRFYYDNDYFGQGEALLLHALMREQPPRRIIEVGSGFSSAVMLDTDDRFLGSTTEFTFIEPHADRLRGLLRETDSIAERIRIIEQPIQTVCSSIFTELEEGDILFIDSSHVVSTGGDVNRLLLEIVPTLHRGVRIHLHDVFWPFEYPEVWLGQGRYWSETYLLQALLINNPKLRIEIFASYLFETQRPEVARRAPAWDATGHAGSSIWLRSL